jgi:hypothetical protein
VNLWLTATILVIARRANICAAVIAFEVADCSDWPEQAGADFVILSSLKTIPSS